VDLQARVSAVEADMIAMRRDLHMHPELAFEEHRTAALVANRLRQLGLEVRTGVAKTGVIGLLHGARPGKTLAIRCDMDALPQTEERQSPYRSQVPGVHHGCGHDAHVAMGLGAATVLAQMRDQLAGTVKFLFEPAEEKVTGDFREPVGAPLMIADGALENPRVDGILSLHVWPLIRTGHLLVPRGMVNTGWDVLDISIIGQETHATDVEQGVDAIAVAAMVINGIQTFFNRKVKITTPATLHIGEIKGGRSRSIVADRVDMYGSLRVADVELRRVIMGQIEQMVKGITEAYGATYELDHVEYLRPIVNEPKLTALVHNAVSRVLGENQVHYVDETRMTGDSFFNYSERVPSVVAWVGTGNPDKDTEYPAHHPLFDIDESGMKVGVMTICATALDFPKE
jgi:amidohydrolase